MIDQKTTVKINLGLILLCCLGIAITLYIVRLRETVTVYKTKAETFEAACGMLMDRHVLADKSNYPFVKKQGPGELVTK